MSKTTRLVLALSLLGLGLHIAPAHAQLARTFVSSFGTDANDCNRLTPCRTFQRAHNQTLASGEITVLDPGGYGALTITKTISIINDGVGEAGMLISGGVAGITINALDSDTVSLRGLTIKGIGFGSGNGIIFNSGKSLTVENCAIRNLKNEAANTGTAISLQTAGPSNFSQLAVSNTIIADNFIGINVSPSGNGVVKVGLSRVELYDNVAGLLVNPAISSASARVSMMDGVVDGNLSGVQVASPGGAITHVTVIHSLVSNNQTALSVNGATANLWVGGSSITGNTGAWVAVNSGLFRSFGDNYIVGNDNQPTPTTVARE